MGLILRYHGYNYCALTNHPSNISNGGILLLFEDSYEKFYEMLRYYSCYMAWNLT